jgi:hypothetical protein
VPRGSPVERRRAPISLSEVVAMTVSTSGTAETGLAQMALPPPCLVGYIVVGTAASVSAGPGART